MSTTATDQADARAECATNGVHSTDAYASNGAHQSSDGVKNVIVIGGGPAGLTAAYELTKFGQRPTVLEKGPIVGGLARTECYKGFHFDMGGHRFFTKSEAVKQVWREVLLDDFLHRSRLSRIYYRKRFFYYPLKPLNALWGLGIFESFLILCSYIKWRLFPYRQEETFEEWVTNRFGKRLFLTFFKTYTEKVWGIPCSELKAEWAAQRIKDLSLVSALLNMIFKPKKIIKTLIDAFEYPRLGPGMMWRAVTSHIERAGGSVRLNSDVVKIHRQGLRIESVTVAHGAAAANGAAANGAGGPAVLAGSDFISSMPITEFIRKLDPPPPPDIVEAASQLSYRDFLTVCLIVNKPELFPDNWIYIHDPEVKVGRIQNFKNWSPDMLPDASKTSLGLEYFCSEGDELWSTPDHQLVALATRELERIGLGKAADVEDGCVFRVPKSYPVYDSVYAQALAKVRAFVDSIENFQTVGRNGLHRYNNQDHAMLTGMLAVRNLMAGERHDLWSVNTEQEYHEEVHEAEAKVRDLADVVRVALPNVFLKLDRLAFGLACGLTLGLALFAATLFLVLKGGPVIGPNLSLLREFFPAYEMTVVGSVIGLGYGLLTGFLFGWGSAFLRNAAVYIYMRMALRRSRRLCFQNLLEYL